MKIYLSGKISGKTQKIAEQDFAKYAQVIADAGHEPVNPMDNGIPFNAPWADHMERDLRLLKGCDAICLLPDWVSSAGARIELKQALQSDMPTLNTTNLIPFLQTAQSHTNAISKFLQQKAATTKATKNIFEHNL